MAINMDLYEIKLIDDDVFGGKGSKYYQVVDYDGNVDKLKEFVKALNDSSNFWISWHIVNENKGLLEQEFDPLD